MSLHGPRWVKEVQCHCNHPRRDAIHDMVSTCGLCKSRVQRCNARPLTLHCCTCPSRVEAPKVSRKQPRHVHPCAAQHGLACKIGDPLHVLQWSAALTRVQGCNPWHPCPCACRGFTHSARKTHTGTGPDNTAQPCHMHYTANAARCRLTVISLHALHVHRCATTSCAVGC